MRASDPVSVWAPSTPPSLPDGLEAQPVSSLSGVTGTLVVLVDDWNSFVDADGADLPDVVVLYAPGGDRGPDDAADYVDAIARTEDELRRAVDPVPHRAWRWAVELDPVVARAIPLPLDLGALSGILPDEALTVLRASDDARAAFSDALATERALPVGPERPATPPPPVVAAVLEAPPDAGSTALAVALALALLRSGLRARSWGAWRDADATGTDPDGTDQENHVTEALQSGQPIDLLGSTVGAAPLRVVADPDGIVVETAGRARALVLDGPGRSVEVPFEAGVATIPVDTLRTIGALGPVRVTLLHGLDG